MKYLIKGPYCKVLGSHVYWNEDAGCWDDFPGATVYTQGQIEECHFPLGTSCVVMRSGISKFDIACWALLIFAVMYFGGRIFIG